MLNRFYRLSGRQEFDLLVVPAKLKLNKFSEDYPAKLLRSPPGIEPGPLVKMTRSRPLSKYLIKSRVCHIWYSFYPCYTCWTIVNFGKLTDGCLEINSSTLNNCFNCRHVFQNGVNSLSNMVLKIPFFVKSSKFSIRFGSNFTLAYGTFFFFF